eukprot:6057103-Prymnesium_polylepis.2
METDGNQNVKNQTRDQKANSAINSHVNSACVRGGSSLHGPAARVRTLNQEPRSDERRTLSLHALPRAPALQRRVTRKLSKHAPCRTHRPPPAPRPDPGTSTTPRTGSNLPHDRYSLARVTATLLP